MIRHKREPVNIILGIFCVILCIFIMAPVFIVVLNSFNGAAYSVFPLEGMSLKWYAKMFSYKKFGSGALNSLITGLIAVVIAIVVGIPASYVMARKHIPGKNLIYSFLMLPLAVPKIVMGLSLFILYVKLGIYGSLFSLGIAHSFLVLPYIMVMVTSAIKGIHKVQEEAAMDLGARPISAFFRVILPQISTATVLAASLGFVVSFDQVEASVFLVRADRYTLPLEMMSYMEKYQDPSIAALSTILVLSVLFISGVFYLRIRKNGISVKGIELR